MSDEVNFERLTGTALYYAIERLGGELRLSRAELDARQGTPAEVWAELDSETGDILITCRVPAT